MARLTINPIIPKPSVHTLMTFDPVTNPQPSRLALQMQATTLLPALSMLLQTHGYHHVQHRRISQQLLSSAVDSQNPTQKSVYQGIMRAQHAEFGKVVIKWETDADVSVHKTTTADTLVAVQGSLRHEIEVLSAINMAMHAQKKVIHITAPILTAMTLAASAWQHTQPLILMVMPDYHNGSLAQTLKNLPTSTTLPQKIDWIGQAAQRLATLHAIGWLHNDIKPSNLLLDDFVENHTDNGRLTRILLTDFAAAAPINSSLIANVAVSHAGTPAYLAPERWHGQSGTVHSDIYAFGILLYEILTGARPYNSNHSPAQKDSRALRDWAVQHCQCPIPTLPKQYQRYQYVVSKTLAKRVEQRYQSMQEVIKDLGMIGS